MSLNDSQLLDQLLHRCVTDDASDLHLTPGLPPHLRLHGELNEIADAPLVTGAQTQALAAELMRRMTGGDVCLDTAIKARGSIDGAMTAPDGTRYLDCYNNVASVGHCHPRVAATTADQSATVATHTCYLRDAFLYSAALLLSICPHKLNY